jgi:hypothetical protein
MALSTFLATLLPVAFGAAIGFIPSFLVERRRERLATNTRWDSQLFNAALELVAAARRAEHLADQVRADISRDEQRRRLDEEHQRLRVAVDHTRMLGAAEVQVAARSILHHSYALRLLSEKGYDPYAEYHPGETPQARLRISQLEFYVAVRRQLRVQKPNDVPLDPRPSPVLPTERRSTPT